MSGSGQTPDPASPSRSGSSSSTSDEWTVRIGGTISWTRVLVVGTWLAVVASFLIWIQGPFWYDGVEWYRQAEEAAAEGDWPLALERVERAREAEPGDPGLATFEGHARLRLGQPETATEAFREGHRLAPDEVEPLLGLAESSLAAGDTAGALESLQDAGQRAPSPADRVRLARLAEASGSPELALDVRLGPPAVGPPSERIRLALRLERWSLAVDLIRESLDDRPDAPPEERIALQRQLAWALQQAGRHAEALEEYGRLASSGDLDRETAVRYAWLLNEEGRHGEALGVLGRVEDETPEVTRLGIQTALWANRLDEAESRLTDALEGRPDDPELLALRRQLTATRERIAAAREEARARGAAEARAREEAARERIARDTPPDDPDAALEFWRERLRETPEDSVARAETVALLESFERFDEAAGTLRVGRGVEEITDSATLLHLARLGQWADRPEAVIRWVERYAELHDPVPDSARLMLARAYDATGADAEALRVYEALVQEDVGGADVTVAVARLRTTTGQPAGATAAYESYLDVRPGDLQVRLEFARHLAARGSLDASREQYARYRADGGPEPVALEVARVELGSERYDEAVAEAREAVRQIEAGTESEGVEAGGGGVGVAEPDAAAAGEAEILEARFTLAEALRYSGEGDEADELLEALAAEDAGPVFRARVARLRDRPLEALEILEGTSTPESRILTARVAMDAGQWARAGRALNAAEAAGAGTEAVGPVQERLRRGTASAVEGLVSGGSDEVDFTQLQAGAAAERWALGDRVRLRSSVESVFLSQGGVDREVVSVTVGGDSLLVGGATFLAGDAGLQLSGSDETTFSGSLRGHRLFRDGSSLDLGVDRAPIWEAEDGFEPLRYSRIRDLSTLGVDLMGTDLTLRGRKTLGIGRAARLDAGLSWYSDGNQRSFLYGHFELPLETRVGRWISLQPNAYVEWFDRSVSSYASPSRYLAAGVRALTIWEGDAGSFRAEANPHFFDYPGDSGIGINAEVEASRAVGGPVQVTVQGFYSSQGSVYDQYRASMGVRWLLGGSDF